MAIPKEGQTGSPTLFREEFGGGFRGTRPPYIVTVERSKRSSQPGKDGTTKRGENKKS